MKKIGTAIMDYIRLTDRWLLLLWVSASALAVMFLFGLLHAELISSDKEIRTMLMAIGIGLTAAVVMSLIDYHFLLKLWKLYLPVCLFFMALTFFSSFATVAGDNVAWLTFELGGRSFSMQPSELLKISFITTFSIHIAKVRDHINRFSTLLLLCLHGGAHVLLIEMQGDTGSALIFLAIFLAMIFCAGIHWRYIFAAAAFVAAMAPVVWFNFMSDDQKMRILILGNPELDPDYAWQQNQAMRAFVYGGLRGSGLFVSDHNYVNVPKAYNDLIFSFIGESTGFVGCLGVIVLLSAIAFKILYNSRLAKEDEGRFICIGVFAMIISQMVINLGMCLGLLPVIGVTLPLFSAGGTSVLALYLGLGFVLGVYCHSQQTLFFD